MRDDKFARWLIDNVLTCPSTYLFDKEIEEILEKERKIARENNTIPRFHNGLVFRDKCYYNNCYECWKAFMEEVEKIKQKRGAK